METNIDFHVRERHFSPVGTQCATQNANRFITLLNYTAKHLNFVYRKLRTYIPREQAPFLVPQLREIYGREVRERRSRINIAKRSAL